jgi:hypothetical protein
MNVLAEMQHCEKQGYVWGKDTNDGNNKIVAFNPPKYHAKQG